MKLKVMVEAPLVLPEANYLIEEIEINEYDIKHLSESEKQEHFDELAREVFNDNYGYYWELSEDNKESDR